MVPAKVTLPYSIAKPIVSPAPNAKMTGFKNISSKAVKINEIIIVITRVCIAVLFTPSWFLAPMQREMAEVAPAPMPLDRPTSIM